MTIIRVCRAISLLVLGCTAVSMQAQATADQIEAAYLYNFGRYVHWPGASDVRNESLDICIFSQNPLASVLRSAVADAKLQGHGVTVRRVETVQEVAGCNILFIDASQSARLHDLLAGLDKSPVLTVSDIPDFLQQGGMIQFVLGRRNVRFKVDLSNVSHAGLTMSSELLKVAVAVQGSVPPGGE
jgi:hypothetical protein